MIKIFTQIRKLFNFYFLSGADYARYLGVTVGSGCRIYKPNFGSEPFLITIGNDCTITAGVKFITHDGTTWLMRDEKGRRYFYQKISVGNNVFIGLNSIIMPGVKIEDKVVVAAGSVVTKSVPSGFIVAGVPAKIIGNFNDIEDRMLKSYISDVDMDLRLPYKERILSVLTNEYKGFLKNE